MTATLLPLPVLDDRRWADLVDEGRVLIPVAAPAWTDHNVHDPGVTLMELLAWIAETDIYRTDRIPDRHVRAFLALAGFGCRLPMPSRAVVGFSLAPDAAAAVTLPAGTQLDAGAVAFRLCRDVSVLPSLLAGVQVESGGRFRDATAEWRRGAAVAPLGPDPAPGDAFHLGFAAPIPAGATVCLHFAIAGDPDDRQRLMEEQASRAEACAARVQDACRAAPAVMPPGTLPPHHGAATQWEAQVAPGSWRTVAAVDDTRALTLSGGVTLSIPTQVPVLQLGANPAALATLRARFAAGAFDAPPVAVKVLANAAEAAQDIPLSESWIVRPGVVATGAPPEPGEVAHLDFDLDAEGRVSRLAWAPADETGRTLSAQLLSWVPATADMPGRLMLEARRLGTGTGAPNQRCSLPEGAFSDPGPSFCSLEEGRLRQWRRRDSLRASGPADADFMLEPGARAVRFGDGRNGRVPPPGAALFCVARTTAGAAGNVAAGAISGLDAGAPNTGRLGEVSKVAASLAQIGNPAPSAGGADEEMLAHAEGRVAAMLARPSRAVTLGDCEALALATPGTRVARASAFANQHPGYPCYGAPGVVTLVIVPALPVGRPVPSPGLLAAVSAYVGRRHVLGTRIVVVGPDYVEVAVHATLRAVRGQNRATVAGAVTAALQRLLDPLEGGQDGTGWPLGRDVYASEVLAEIARVPGVDHVTALELAVPGQGPQCGNVCLGPLALTVSGSHRIEVS